MSFWRLLCERWPRGATRRKLCGRTMMGTRGPSSVQPCPAISNRSRLTSLRPTPDACICRASSGRPTEIRRYFYAHRTEGSRSRAPWFPKRPGLGTRSSPRCTPLIPTSSISVSPIPTVRWSGRAATQVSHFASSSREWVRCSGSRSLLTVTSWCSVVRKMVCGQGAPTEPTFGGSRTFAPTVSALATELSTSAPTRSKPVFPWAARMTWA